jgi:hypothetical protein
MTHVEQLLKDWKVADRKSTDKASAAQLVACAFDLQQAIKADNKDAEITPVWTNEVILPKVKLKIPKPPIIVVVEEGAIFQWRCPKCSSTMKKKYILFGKKECINKRCELNKEGADDIVAEYIEEKGW